MYLARFAGDAGRYVSAAVKWPAASGTLVPDVWRRQLLAPGGPDVALRVTRDSGVLEAVLLLTVGDAGENELKRRYDALLAARPPGLVIPAAADAFDAITTPVPAWQTRVHHDSFHHGGQSLACDFRLYTAIASSLDGGAAYQVHLAPHRPDTALERRVRKYLAWLEVEQPFTEAVREMQRKLALRLLEPGWSAVEYFALPDADGGERWLDQIRAHFLATTGRMGFPDAPLEVGHFTDSLTTGFELARDLSANIAARGASLFDSEEVSWLLSGAFALPRVGSPGAAPDIFISYASHDFAAALSVCRALETRGVTCWIAPRDIEKQALPYTEAIQMSLSQVRAVVVLVSDAASASVHVPRELDLALELKLPIVPLRLEDRPPSGQLNYLLRTCQWLNMWGRGNDEAMEELFGRLRSNLR